jgi:hypothetical protein
MPILIRPRTVISVCVVSLTVVALWSAAKIHNAVRAPAIQQPLSSAEHTRLFFSLRAMKNDSVYVGINRGAALELAGSLANVFRRSGWNVDTGYSPYALDLVGVVIFSCSKTAADLREILSTATYLRPELRCLSDSPKPDQIVIAVGEKFLSY